jgi:hypothetical protein
MFPPSSSPRRQAAIRLSIDRLSYLLAGLAIGFLSATFVTLTILSPSSSASSSSSSFRPSPRGENDAKIGNGGNGWNEIHVFVGGDDSDENDEQRQWEQLLLQASAISPSYFRTTRWFSQARQDELVAGLLRYKRRGYFVDLAANDAVKISNTFALERDYDWSGLAIEPNPTYWRGLIHRPRATIVAAVVAAGEGGPARQQHQVRAFRFPKEKAPQGGLVDLVQTVSAVSKTTDHRRNNNNNEIQLQPTVSLVEVLDRFSAPSGTSSVPVV